MKLRDLLGALSWGTKTTIFEFFEETKERKEIFSGFSNEAIRYENLRNLEVLTIYSDEKSLEISVTK